MLLRCAVVVEVVVPVHTVLRLVVCVYGIGNGSLLLVGKVQHLLSYAASRSRIVGDKVAKVFYTHLVVGQSEDEAQHKEGLVEGEDAVVDGKVGVARLVVKAYSRMAIKTVHVWSWATREQANLHRIHFFVGRLGLAKSRQIIC